MSISYEGIGEWCATFVCGAVSEGDIVKVSANGTVGKCTAGDGFCGVVRAVAHDGKACTVQLGGLASVKYSGTAPAVGFSELMADGSGGVSKPGENQSGSISAHRTAKTRRRKRKCATAEASATCARTWRRTAGRCLCSLSARG